jgi:periplasmic divalent cation tolerance protein
MLYSTWPDRASAETAARALVEARLAACANVLDGTISVFRWNGEICARPEAVMFAKTAAGRAAEAREALIRAHPYDLPCVIAFRLDGGTSSEPFLVWLESETSRRA